MRSLVFLPGLAGCATVEARPAVDVAEVSRSIRAFDGREGRFTGWIASCGGLNRTLHASDRGLGDDSVERLTIGRRDGFDERAAQRAPGWITFHAPGQQ